jgi:hypothetical protein
MYSLVRESKFASKSKEDNKNERKGTFYAFHSFIVINLTHFSSAEYRKKKGDFKQRFR